MDINVEAVTPASVSFTTINDILVFLNPYGRFQWIINALLSIALSGPLVHVITPYFLSMEPSWRCIANSTICSYNSTVEVSTKERCNLPRNEWEYTEPIEYSIISQFDLICGREWMNYLSASSTYVGWAVGSVLVGYVADKYGRKMVVIPAAALIFTISIISAFSPNILMLIAFRFIIGVLMSGVAPVSFILMGEFVDTEHRPVAMVIMSIVYAFAFMLLGVQAYFFRRWKYLLIACTFPYVIVIAFYKFMPESIHWLHSHGSKDELINVIKQIAYWNKVELPADITKDLVPSKNENNASSLTNIFGKRILLKRTLSLSYGWFVTIMLYFGVSLAADDLGGSVYLNFILACFVEVPANIFLMFASRKFGRKPTTCGSILLGSVAYMAIAFIPLTGKVKIIRVVLGVFGKGCVTVTYVALYIWSFEVYSMTNRSYALGFFAVIGYLGGASAPWIVKGLKSVNEKAPFFVMGVAGIVCAFQFLILPETKNKVEDVN